MSTLAHQHVLQSAVHLRHCRTANEHRHPHAGKTAGHCCAAAETALQQADGNYGGEQAGIGFMLPSATSQTLRVYGTR